jgi:glutaredoxin-like YruB-family protein
MTIQEINSHEELLKFLKKENRSFLLIYKKDSPQSEAAFTNISVALGELPDIKVYAVNVTDTRDVHPVYNITSAPALLEFEKSELKNVIKGAHDKTYYRSLFENVMFVVRAEKEGKPVKHVTVYTTPTCSWCNTLKSYLRQHMIRYTEIDVSRDESAAREMQNRSGQQGVPQTMINGEMVVGFDKTRINRLLEIEG